MTTNKNYPLENAVTSWGASMGRPDVLPDVSSEPVRLSLVRLRWCDGDYDAGGAYWGRSPGAGDMWRGVGDASDVVVEVFVRARSRDDAKAAIVAKLPAATFYR